MRHGSTPGPGREIDQSHPLRVVIADDRRTLRELVAARLGTAAEVQVVGQAGDGVEAVDLVERLSPDVVVMDLEMPRMGDVEATRRIAGRHPGVRVVGFSSTPSESLLVEMLNAGAVAYVDKLAPPETLLDAVRTAADGG